MSGVLTRTIVRQTSAKEVRAILGLDGPARFAHFVKRVADDQLVWGLFKDGWLLMEDNQRVRVFPLWPARPYAELCATGDWQSAEPKSMALDDLMTDLGPRLDDEGTLLGIFPTPSGRGVTLPYRELAVSLSAELEQYS